MTILLDLKRRVKRLNKDVRKLNLRNPHIDNHGAVPPTAECFKKVGFIHADLMIRQRTRTSRASVTICGTEYLRTKGLKQGF